MPSTTPNPVAGASNIPLWGRAYSLSVKLASGEEHILSQDSWEPEALRVEFDVLESTLPSPFWYALVSVYNLNDPELQNLLFNAVWLTLSAGYQFGPSKSSVIWDGPILQVMFDRRNVTDLVMTFNCVAGPWLLEQQFINVAVDVSSQYQIVSKMISQVGGNANAQVSDRAQQLLDAKKLPRGKTIFGRVSKFISEISDDNFLNNWIQGNQNYVTELYNPAVKVNPDLIYGPPIPPNYFTGSPDNANITRSILGVPRQSPFGVLFNVLLDPRLKVQLPPLLVKLDQTVITQLKIQYGQVLTPLDVGGLFVAAQVRHYGDTRGNDWGTEVTGYNRTYCQNLLNGVFNANAGTP